MKNRYEVMFFIQAKNCNPNGDPDMGNAPRIDPETNYGYITDVAIKRRIRNYIDEAFAGKEGMEIIKQQASNMNRAIYECLAAVSDGKVDAKKNKSVEASQYACAKYFDVRAFGDVLSTGLNAGQVRGPVQIAFASSVDPILPLDMCITRMCYTEGKGTTLKEYDDIDAKLEDDKKRTMGRKSIIPYGLYVVRMSISANLADKTGFNEEDLNVLFEAIMNMYNNDISSSKMGMTVLQPMVIFKHVGTQEKNNEEQLLRETKLGCAPSHVLFDLVHIEKKENVEYARDYRDYDAYISLDKLPNGVQVGFKYGPFDEIVWDKPTNDWLKY